MASADISPPRKRKRARTVISCTECHRRKQKCDRQHPCGNCMLRSASHLCQYESRSSANNASTSPARTHVPSRSLKGESPESPGEIMPGGKDVPGEFGYIRSNTHTALGVLEKLDLDGHGHGYINSWTDETVDLSECVEIYAYAKHIRQIPPRPYTSLLVKIYFEECNWIYGVLHEHTFVQHMEAWFDQCALNNPPTGVDKRKILSQFPALLLQVLAVALQMLPKEHYRFMSQLNLGKETFYNLSAAYSNTACELASLLSGSSPTLVRVQQWFLRCSWLKSEGRAVEAWHALGQGIREAQEMELHREQPRKFLGVESIASIWQREFEKRVWINLYIWDRFMAMILGRPTMINDRHCNATPPIDCQIPLDITELPPIPRGPLDPPNAFTERLLEYQLAGIVNEIDDMEVKVDKPLPLDFSSVDLMHSKVLSFTEFFPPALAVHSRDTSYDQQYSFLATQCELLKSSAFCLIVGLHRPFVFTRDRSKMELVKASLVILDSQTRVFQITKPHHHNLYTLCFFTFDPAVLIAAVIITSPGSLAPEMVDACIEALREGHQRLETLGSRIKLAEKGAAVLKVLLSKAEGAVSSVHRIDGLLNRTRISSTSPESDGSTGASPFPSCSELQSRESSTPSVLFRSTTDSPTLMSAQLEDSMQNPEMVRPYQMNDFDWTSYTNDIIPHRDLMSMDLEDFFSTPELAMNSLGIATDAIMAHHHEISHGHGQDVYASSPGGGCTVEEQQSGDNFWQNLLSVQFQ